MRRVDTMGIMDIERISMGIMDIERISMGIMDIERISMGIMDIERISKSKVHKFTTKNMDRNETHTSSVIHAGRLTY
ncbi:hypothetical protein DPMN_068697 [Dreissena polymorpha]|uniref:Uncharacterized protein n=1 Tax=Dreissena polymorpha TaxID=45954 RepID=A0A9D4BTT1_DREPO|nr:hypothetical protein DPMN_068697 [Dreissena polymorpha]